MHTINDNSLVLLSGRDNELIRTLRQFCAENPDSEIQRAGQEALLGLERGEFSSVDKDRLLDGMRNLLAKESAPAPAHLNRKARRARAAQARRASR